MLESRGCQHCVHLGQHRCLPGATWSPIVNEEDAFDDGNDKSQRPEESFDVICKG